MAMDSSMLHLTKKTKRRRRRKKEKKKGTERKAEIKGKAKTEDTL